MGTGTGWSAARAAGRMSQDSALRELRDRQEIHDVLMRYCRGVDRCDASLVRSVYHPDAHDDHGYWHGNGHEFATFVTQRLLQANSATTHSVTNVLIELTADLALSESYVQATLVRRGTPVIADVMGARYHDRLSRRAGVWRIEQRTVVLDWHKTEPWDQSDQPIPLDGFQRGTQGPHDPIYRFLAPENETNT
jgi:hypothetical protein